MKLRTLIDLLKTPENAEGLTAEQLLDLDVKLEAAHANAVDVVAVFVYSESSEDTPEVIVELD